MTDFSPYGNDLFGKPREPNGSRLQNRYAFNPFDIIDGRSERWKDRKRAWLSLGLESHEGREGHSSWNSRAHSNGLGQWLSKIDNVEHRTDFAHGSRTGHEVSVFDPCLAELCVRFWSGEGDVVFDPFAGGSVRGVVSVALGRVYVGVDLRQEQVETNRAQADRIGLGSPEWIVGDALTCDTPDHSLLFTCPPYGDLERYSDDPRDLSTMDAAAFLEGVTSALVGHAARCSGFVVVVCNAYRAKAAGNYHGLVDFPARLTTAMVDGGFALWEDCAFLTPLGTVPVRASHNWRTGQKLGRCHQRVLVFKP